MLIYVKILNIQSLRNFIGGHLNVHSIQPVNIFKIGQELCNLEQNIYVENSVNKHYSADSHVQQGINISLEVIIALFYMHELVHSVDYKQESTP